MSLIKWNNQPDLFNGIVDRFFEDFGTDFYHSTPAVNITESDEAYYLEIAAPGLNKDDFQLSLDHNILTVSAEQKAENEDKDNNGKYKRREFSYTSFKRSFTLPNSVDADGIGAKYENGVLNLSVPKREEVKPRTIAVL